MTQKAQAAKHFMIIPVRCFTCGKVLADKYHTYLELLDSKYDPADALDYLGLTRYCCRRIMLTHIDFNDQLLKFNPADNAMALNAQLQAIPAHHVPWAAGAEAALVRTGTTPQSSPHQ